MRLGIYPYLAVILLVASALAGYALVTTPVPADDFSQIRGAVKELTAVTDSGETRGFCSAVLIDEHTLLTAAHCDIKRDVYVNGYRAFIVKKDEARDLMMLHVPVGLGCPCVAAAVMNPARDSQVVVVGFPLDAGQVLTEGRYEGAAIGNRGAKGLILITAALTWGNSGGGVFMRSGDHWALIGIVSRGTIFPMDGFIPVVIAHLNYAAGAQSISDFVQGE